MTEENFEEQMARAWRMEAKRLEDEELIVLNVFVYLKEKEPMEPGPPGRPPGRGTAAVAAAVTAASGSGAIPGGGDGEHAIVRRLGAPRGLRMRPRLLDGTAVPGLGAGTGAAGTVIGDVRPKGNVPGPGTGTRLLPPRPPRPGPGRPGRPPLPPHLRRRPPPPGLHAAGVGPEGGPGPIRRGPGRPPGRPPFRPPLPGMQGTRVRPAAVDQTIRYKISTLTRTGAATAAVARASTPISAASSTSPSAIPANIPPNPTRVSVTLPPSAIRTQAPRAASAFARQQHHRLTAIPQIHPPSPPPAPIGQDHDMEDVNNNHSTFEDMMQDEFDRPGLEELQRTYDIHAPPSTSPPPTVDMSTSSSAASSSSIHTYSNRPHPLGARPRHQAQTAQAEQAESEDDGDFKLINIKINGLVVPIMFDIKSLREAIFS
ncbi:MAG: hypothetical protein JOS17DRAFT_725786 [Linnemannia elongata]|nr:MAG: hypothetical protein JOS17DRAFT_725786 [Linnemannia elongata]